MAKLQIRELTPAFGAEVQGLEARELDEQQVGQLRNLFDERGMLLFRGLDIDREYQTYLVDLLIGYERPADGFAKGPVFVSNKEDGGLAPFGRLLFHSDMMWAPDPFQVLSLYAVEVEPPSVPTVFASTTSAWETLPEELRAQIEDLHVVHVTGQQRRGGDDEDLLEPIREHEQSTTTPVAHAHPRTGRKMLYVSQMNTREIAEMAREESEELLEALFSHLYDPVNTWQHEWITGDLVAWDNLAVQHARSVVRKEGPVRTLRKVISPVPSLERIEVPRFTGVS